MAQIHELNGKFKIDDGAFNFNTKQEAIDAFEKWIKTKSDESYNKLGQDDLHQIYFVEKITKNYDQWTSDPDIGDMIKARGSEFKIHDLLNDLKEQNKIRPNEEE